MKAKITLLSTITLLLIGIFLLSAKSTNTKSKVGHIDTNELWRVMPEKKSADEKLKIMEQELITYYQTQQKSLKKSILDFYKDSATMSDLVKNKTISKIQQEQQSLKKMPEEMQAELTKNQNDLYAPIQDKMQDAVNEVAEENNYDYIFDTSYGNIVYVKHKEDDILPLVKLKLGL